MNIDAKCGECGVPVGRGRKYCSDTHRERAKKRRARQAANGHVSVSAQDLVAENRVLRTQVEQLRDTLSRTTLSVVGLGGRESMQRTLESQLAIAHRRVCDLGDELASVTVARDELQRGVEQLLEVVVTMATFVVSVGQRGQLGGGWDRSPVGEMALKYAVDLGDGGGDS